VNDNNSQSVTYGQLQTLLKSTRLCGLALQSLPDTLELRCRASGVADDIVSAMRKYHHGPPLSPDFGMVIAAELQSIMNSVDGAEPKISYQIGAMNLVSREIALRAKIARSEERHTRRLVDALIAADRLLTMRNAEQACGAMRECMDVLASVRDAEDNNRIVTFFGADVLELRKQKDS